MGSLRGFEPLPHLVELGVERRGHVAAEPVVVLANRRQLGEPTVDIDAQQFGEVLGRPTIEGRPLAFRGMEGHSPVFHIGKHIMYGATAHSFVELLEILAEALWLAGQHREAQVRFDALLAADPENRQALLGSARIQLALGELDAARAALERAQQVEPEDSADLREEASLLVALGRPEEAQARLRAALALEPYDGAAALALARLRAEAGAPEAEVTALKRRAARFGTETGSG